MGGWNEEQLTGLPAAETPANMASGSGTGRTGNRSVSLEAPAWSASPCLPTSGMEFLGGYAFHGDQHTGREFGDKEMKEGVNVIAAHAQPEGQSRAGCTVTWSPSQHNLQWQQLGECVEGP